METKAKDAQSSNPLPPKTETTKASYTSPTILDVGSVESLTHGSREQTSDEPRLRLQGRLSRAYGEASFKRDDEWSVYCPSLAIRRLWR